MKTIRVALIAPHLDWGGVQALFLVQTRDAAALGVEYSVFSLAPPAMAPYAEALAGLGVEVVHEPGRRVLDIQRARRLARRLAEGRFDVAHGHLWPGNLVGAWAAAVAGLPFLGGLHLPGPGAGARAAVRGWAEAVALRCGALAATACAEAVAVANRRRLGRLPIIALTNPAPDRFPPGPAARAAAAAALGADGRPLFVAIGRLSPEKDLDTALAAARLLLDRGVAFRLALVGSGPDAGRLAARAVTLGLGAQVALTGPRGDIAAILASADAYVGPGLTEGLSMAMLEAMAEGLPVIVADLGEARQFIAEDAGILVPPGDPAALADAMARVAADPALRARLGAAARARVAARADADRWRRALASLYRAAAEGQPLMEGSWGGSVASS